MGTAESLEILAGKWVTAETVRLRCVDSRRGVEGAPSIFGGSDNLQMVRITTGFHPAKVVNLHSVACLDFHPCKGSQEPMSRKHLTAYIRAPIARIASRSAPQPATSVRFGVDFG
jgi:hypothetical protein